MRIVAGGAVEAVRTADLVRAGDFLELLHVAVAFVADSRRDRAEMLRASPQGRESLRGANVTLPAGAIARLCSRGSVVGDLGHLGHGADRRKSVNGHVSRLYGCRRSRRDVVMGSVTIDAGDLTVGVLRTAPTTSFGASVFFVATEAGFRANDGITRFETEDQPRFSALCF